MWSGDLFQCLALKPIHCPDADCARIPMSPSWQALLISHTRFWIWHLWGKILWCMWCMSSLLLSLRFSFWLWLLHVGHDVMDDWNVPPGQRWFAHRNHVALQGKFKHRISQEKKPKVVNDLFCWCLSMSFCSSISYTFLQTHLNTFSQSHQANPPGGEPQDLNPPNPPKTWLWQGSSKICPKIDGPNVLRSQKAVKSLPAHSFGPILVRLFCVKNFMQKGQRLKGDLQPEVISMISTPNFTSPNLTSSPAKPLQRAPSHAVVQRTEVSSPWLSAVLRVWKSQRSLHLWHLHQINEYQWIKLNQQTQKVCSFGVSDS